MLVGLLAATVLAIGPPSPSKTPDECDRLYYGEGRPRDYGKALACYEAAENWVMIEIMRLNGEGMPVAVGAARADLDRRIQENAGWSNVDVEALDRIIKEREAHPPVEGRHVDFCRDVAGTTISLAYCQRRELDRKIADDDSHLEKARAALDPRAQAAFDEAVSALRSFADEDGGRVYQKHIDGTIRIQAAIDQEALVRRDFVALMTAFTSPSASGPPAGQRRFETANGELDAVCKKDIRSYVEECRAGYDGDDRAQGAQYIKDYKSRSKDAQDAWVRYRDAMAAFGARRWPELRDAQRLVKALVTEDRIRELRHDVGN